MKKFLAVLMSIVMMFALVAMPVSAAKETATTETADTITLEEFFSTLELTVGLIQDTILKVHYIVGSILGMLEKECPLCGEAHEADFTIGEITGGETTEDISSILAELATVA